MEFTVLIRSLAQFSKTENGERLPSICSRTTENLAVLFARRGFNAATFS